MTYFVEIQEVHNGPIDRMDEAYPSIDKAVKWINDRAQTQPFYMGEVVNAAGDLLYHTEQCHMFDSPTESFGIPYISTPSEEKGTTVRHNQGKPDLSLIPLITLIDEARVWEFGKKKYTAYNWMKGTSWMSVLSCALRHLAKWQAGEDVDEESGLPHLAHAMANLRMLTLYGKTFKEGDDRPPKELLK